MTNNTAYIVTTHDRSAADAVHTSRRAVATLDVVWPIVEGHHGEMTEQGGTVTLPDGTVIEVERQPDGFDVDAYNAAQEV